MKKFYFTFGAGQKHEGHYVEVIAEDSEAARKNMFSQFGNRWSMQYTEEEFAGQPRKYGIVKLTPANLKKVRKAFPCPSCGEDLRYNLKSIEEVVNSYGWKISRDGVIAPDGSRKMVSSEISHFECHNCHHMLSEEAVIEAGLTIN